MEHCIEQLLGQLTLEEKVSMIHGAGLFRTGGVPRLDIPPMHFADGPMGVRAEFANDEWRSIGNTDDYVTYLPCNSALASTWNRELARTMGSTLGEEARGRGKDMILAPGINIKRSPLCGRNFEYMSEDPCLVSELVVPLVQGIQEHDVAACVKHFAANSQETERLWVDTIVDEQTLREIYFPGFKAAVEKGGIFGLMGAYNLLNGEHCCTSRTYLNQVLRQEWGFDGLVVSDWGGVHDTHLAAESGLDVEMDVTYDFQNHHLARPLLEKVRAGQIPETLIDEKIRNILRCMLRLKMIGPAKEDRSSGSYNTPEHRSAALEVARESVVLLKNEENRLPLDPQKVRSVAVIGAAATAVHSLGGGSAEIKALYEITPLMGIKKLLGGNVKVDYAPGYCLPVEGEREEISWQASSTWQDVPVLARKESDSGEESLAQALQLAKDADAVIFVGGLNHDYDVEGLDRPHMGLPYGQDRVISELLKLRPDAVITLYAGSPVEMPWLDSAKTLLWSYYAGMEGGTALAECIFGRVNPSGKLAETFIQNADQCPAKLGVNFGLKDKVIYTEGVMVGYRHYNTAHTAVNFPFGHGLSYTEFSYSDLSVDGDCVTLKVKNIGNRPGKETVQLYIGASQPGRPAHQLRGFEKVTLDPGEETSVRFTLTDMDFSSYVDGAFRVIPGVYEVQIGASSRDIRLRAEVQR